MATRTVWARAAIGGLTFLLLTIPRPGQMERPVGLELVLAVSGSGSITDQTLKFHPRGYAASFRDEAVLNALLSQTGDATALTLIRWPDPGDVQTLVPTRGTMDVIGGVGRGHDMVFRRHGWLENS